MICMSLSSKHMGLLISSPRAFNRVMWSISFAAFYSRFLVAIKMLLKLPDFSTPSLSVQPLLRWLTPVEWLLHRSRACSEERNWGWGAGLCGSCSANTDHLHWVGSVWALLSSCLRFPDANQGRGCLEPGIDRYPLDNWGLLGYTTDRSPLDN